MRSQIVKVEKLTPAVRLLIQTFLFFLEETEVFLKKMVARLLFKIVSIQELKVM